MIEADRMAVYQLTSSKNWPAVLQLAEETVNDALKKGLAGDKADADDAVIIARGATRFLAAFRASVDGIRQQFGAPPSAVESILPEDTPLSIL